jgi:hypothetical protein
MRYPARKGRLNIRKAKEANRLADKRAKWAKARAQSRAKKRQGRFDGYIQSKAKRLLQDWANFEDPWAVLEPNQDPPAKERLAWLIRRHPDVFGDFVEHPEILRSLFQEVSRRLRDAWEESDLARRQWWLFEARRQHEVELNSAGFALALGSASAGVLVATRTIPYPPVDTVFNQALICVQDRLAQAMQVCRNPDCHTRYFFKPEKASQYCQPECATWGLAAAKERYELKNRPAKGLPTVRSDPGCQP